jgi:hypothetical protein
MPQARGSATISGEQGYMKIQARFDKVGAAARFGPRVPHLRALGDHAEGRATNLGEVQVDNDDAKVEVTTELQAFGLVVTAEPYFAVTQPSDVVVIENVIRDDTKRQCRSHPGELRAPPARLVPDESGRRAG